MATYSWRASGTDFGTATDWTTTDGDPSSAPGGADTAVLAGGSGAVTGTGNVDTLLFGGASWTVLGQLGANTTSVGAGALTLSGAGSLTTGSLGTAVIGGASATVNVIGTAQLAVIGAGAFGAGGSGTLTVATRGIAGFNGPVVFGRDGGSGAATVDSGVLSVSGVLQFGAGTTGATGSASVQNGGELILQGAADASAAYLQLGANPGTGGFVQVNGTGSVLLASNNSAAIGLSGTGGLSISNGALGSFSTSNNAINPAVGVGLLAGGAGTLSVAGSGSSLRATGAIIVGGAGRGTASILAGATATSLAFTAAQAALAVGASPGGSGTLTIDGAGSQLTASGQAVIGGNNTGAGVTGGGSAAVVITNGAALQSSGMTILPSGTVGIDRTSTEADYGDLALFGGMVNSGTLIVAGNVIGSAPLQLAGGYAEVGGLANATVSFVGSSATLRVHSLTGTSTINGLTYGDRLDLAGITAVRLTGNTVLTTAGSLTLGAAPAGAQYALSDDGSGGTFVGIAGDTVGVYRFFDSHYGTHFFTGSAAERDTIIASRPDLVFEGVGLQSVDPASNDPNSAPVYRFFDSVYGTHFFTASVTERDTIINTRPDLLYEGNGFNEHTAAQPGDVPVYRFFDSNYGTHFYTADAGERATVLATRPDLVDEGIGFYAPS